MELCRRCGKPIDTENHGPCVRWFIAEIERLKEKLIDAGVMRRGDL